MELVTILWYELIARWAEGDQVIASSWNHEELEELQKHLSATEHPYHGWRIETRTQTGKLVE